tara:strand:- start:3261 stop:3965 length:705 start_codon:yes stop_codon:yes gene_type:complete
MADLNFYEKDMAKIQDKLIEKLGKVLSGLSILSDAELTAAFEQINLLDDLNELGVTALLRKIKGSYDRQAVKSYGILTAAQKTKQTATAVQAIEVLAVLDLTTLSQGIAKYADELKTAMLRGLLTGQSSDSILQQIQQTYGGSRALSSPGQAALLNDSFARFNRATTAKLFQEFPEQRYVYVGPNDDRTREVCELTLGEVGDEGLTIEEVNSLSTGATFEGGGGFNCRHEWIPV